MKYFGSYEIAKAMGMRVDYVKVATLLNLVEAPMTINKRNANAYCLNGKQVKYLKRMLKEMREELNK